MVRGRGFFEADTSCLGHSSLELGSSPNLGASPNEGQPIWTPKRLCEVLYMCICIYVYGPKIGPQKDICIYIYMGPKTGPPKRICIHIYIYICIWAPQ